MRNYDSRLSEEGWNKDIINSLAKIKTFGKKVKKETERERKRERERESGQSPTSKQVSLHSAWPARIVLPLKQLQLSFSLSPNLVPRELCVPSKQSLSIFTSAVKGGH